MLSIYFTLSWNTIAYQLPFTDPRKRAVFDDAFTTDVQLSSGLEVFLGTTMDSKLLFHADRTWEFRIDNGFPSVVYDAADSPPYKMWYHGFLDCKWHPPECHPDKDDTGLMYAESTDGLTWTKPALKLAVIPDSHYEPTNNVIWSGGYGFGVFKDPWELNQSRIYKAFGRLRQPFPGKEPNSEEVGGTMVSMDGIHWTDAQEIRLKVQWDTHHSVLWDRTRDRYVVVTKGLEESLSMVMSLSASGSFHGFAPPEVVATPLRLDDNIISAQVFDYYGVYLAFLTTTSDRCSVLARYPCAGHLRCELAWSSDLRRWSRFRPPQWQTRELPSDFGKLNFSSRDYDEVVPLRVGSFHSHRCFAAKPVEVPGEGMRIYFVGGNDPLPGHRAAFGLARFRPDGLVGIRAIFGEVGRLTTKPLVLQGDGILIAAEIEEGGSIQVEVLDADSLKLKGKTLHAEARRPRHTSLFQSLSDHQILANEALAALMGTQIRLRFRLYRAQLYTFSFREPKPLKSSLQRDFALVWPVLSKTFLLVLVILFSSVGCWLLRKYTRRRSIRQDASLANVVGRPLD